MPPSIFLYLFIEYRYTVYNTTQLKRVPFGPHFGYRVILKGHKTTKGTLIKYPSPLPYGDFNKHLPNHSQEDLDQHWHTAKTKAQEMLQTQQTKTGFAILGHPEPLILADLKLKGETLKDSLRQATCLISTTV